MAGACAVFAGGGALPLRLSASERVGLTVKFAGMPFDGAQGDIFEASLSKVAPLFEALQARSIKEVCFAGAMSRPEATKGQAGAEQIDPSLQAILKAETKGDDGLLRQLAQFIEAQGFAIVGAHELCPELLAQKSILSARAPSESERADSTRGRQILDILAPEDIGQALVIEGGLCLGIETLPGTDALLAFVRQTRTGRGGVLVKRAKKKQDLRFDMPTIGTDTILAAQSARLSAIALSAGSVLLLDAQAIIKAADAADIALWAEP